MINFDLSDVEKAVNKSRQEFLDELESYDRDGSNDEERLTTQFLSTFLGSEKKRSNISRQQAKETIRLINNFKMHLSFVASKVAQVNLKMQSTLAKLQLDFISESIDKVGSNAGSDALDNSATQIFERATAIGEQVDLFQKIVGTLLLLRRTTLQTFRREAVDVTWSDLKNRIEKELKDFSRNEIFEKSWDVIRDNMLEILKIMSEEYIDGLRKYWRMIRRIFGGKTIPPYGATDTMQRLLEQLRRHNEMLEELDTTFDVVMSELDSLSQFQPNQNKHE